MRPREIQTNDHPTARLPELPDPLVPEIAPGLGMPPSLVDEVYGFDRGAGFGVRGDSVTGEGVHGETETGVGVCGRVAATPGVGVGGISAHGGYGVAGTIEQGGGVGVFGRSDEGIGIWGDSVDGLAGRFTGAVDVSGDATIGGIASIEGWASVGGAATIGGDLTVGAAAASADLSVHGDGQIDGSLIVGTVRPGRLDVRGDIQVAGDVFLAGADCAEEFRVSGEAVPGTVMTITEDGSLRPSDAAYDRRVAGVVSGAGDFRPGVILGSPGGGVDRRPVGLAGRTYCLVDASYAPVEVGDLLTTSSTPGHAMKADDPGRAFGAVLGKALQPLASGAGLVPILIALQ